MYIGPNTDDPPTPRPPMNRKTNSAFQLHAIPQPSAEIRYRIAITRRLSRRPFRSPGIAASDAPRIVPTSAIATVNPSPHSDKAKVFFNPAVVPEMTAVSNPNSNPPSAATTVLLISVAVILTRAFLRRPVSVRLSPPAPALPALPPGCQAAVAECIRPAHRVCPDAARSRSTAWRTLP